MSNLMEIAQIGDFSRNSDDVIDKINKGTVVLRKGSNTVAVMVSPDEWECMQRRLREHSDLVGQLMDAERG